ncbi:flagellar motor protein MotB [Limnohabitans sp. MMS-10A-160]|uniref:outer membrane beta-barrel protein n=1 Tax=unclassified Limnohabitans TaxID=2626134 RepID=UPI000D365599|nr:MULTISPECIES: outer membrane beta-barrel protein [unclassified Limnohabitans]PUE19885.1 flagellar motor protein MotB [Limnohabitans sp. MMS-10A-192]PUE27210.1 flagellar motor protein MotB [Limnohabitans sp. MMS-10A-160]
MKKLNFHPRPTLLALAMLASPLLHAQEGATNTGMYVGISAGESKAHIDNARITQSLLGAGLVTDSLTEDRKDTGYKAFVGFPINPYWAVETGYFDLGRFGFTANTTPAGSLTGSARIKGLNLDLVGTLPITDKWSLLGRVGAAYALTKDTFSGTGAVSVSDPSPSKRETNYKYGFGTQYAFTPALTLRLEAERYRINDAVGNRGDVDLVSLGLVYRFGGSTPTATKTAYTPYVAPPPAPTPAPVVVAAAPVAPAPMAPAPKPWVKVKLEADSLFGFDQDQLQSDGKLALDKLLMELQTVNIDSIAVTGHTDRLGTKAYNAKLSTRRAEAVQAYLVQVGGIPASKVTAMGVGSSQPETQASECKGSKATQALITCLRVDRRVEVDVMGSQQQR